MIFHKSVQRLHISNFDVNEGDVLLYIKTTRLSIIMLQKWVLRKGWFHVTVIKIATCIEEINRGMRQGQIKKIPVFRVIRPYPNLLVQPRFFSTFLEKNIILCILKGEMPFKMHRIIFFPETKNNLKKYVCAYPT